VGGGSSMPCDTSWWLVFSNAQPTCITSCYIIVAMTLSCPLLGSLFFVFATAIWPQPAHYTHGGEVVWFDDNSLHNLQSDIVR